MEETRYLISETAKLVQVEPHVLRYWEEELGLSIKRNEMGHRYYTDKDLEIFQKIKELKKQGFQLKTIRKYLHEKEREQTESPCLANQGKKENTCAAANIQVKIVTPRKFQEQRPETQEEEKQSRDERFQEIMRRLIHDIELKERKEGRYRRLDEAIRRHQQSRKMVAATRENSKSKKRKDS